MSWLGWWDWMRVGGIWVLVLEKVFVFCMGLEGCGCL